MQKKQKGRGIHRGIETFSCTWGENMSSSCFTSDVNKKEQGEKEKEKGTRKKKHIRLLGGGTQSSVT